jgi:hypothetical protein
MTTNDRHPFSRSLRGLCLVASLAIAGAPLACSNVLGIEPDPQVTPPTPGPKVCQGTIQVRIITDASGPVVATSTPIAYATVDYIRKLNSAGGLRGCMIEYQVADNHYDGVATMTILDGWRQSDPTWAQVNTVFIASGTPGVLYAGPSLMQEKKVLIAASYDGTLASPNPTMSDVGYLEVGSDFSVASLTATRQSSGWPFLFFPATDYSTALRLGIRAAWKIAPGKIAMAHDATSAYANDPLYAGKSFVSSLPGMTLGRDLIYPIKVMSPTDDPTAHDNVLAYFTEEIAHVKDNATYVPVTWIWAGNTAQSSTLLGKYIAEAQQMIDSSSDISAATKSSWKLKVMANNWGINEGVPAACGTACNDIYYGLFPVPRYGDLDKSSGMASLIALHDEYSLKEAVPPLAARSMEDFRTVQYVNGYASMFLWQKGMEAAIDFGHSNPTGEDLKRALETFQSVDTGGLTAGPVTFTPTDHRPQSTENIYKIDSTGQLSFINEYSIQLVPTWLGY